MKIVGTASFLLLAIAAARAESETRPLTGPVTKVISNSAVDVKIKALKPGENSTMTVEAPKGQLAQVKTDVVGDTLTVSVSVDANATAANTPDATAANTPDATAANTTKAGNPSTTTAPAANTAKADKAKGKGKADTPKNGKMEVTVLLASIAEVTNQGDGDLDIEGFMNVSTLVLTSGGSGELEFEGSAADVQVKMSGDGDVSLDSKKAIATSLTVDMAGTGSLKAEDFQAKTVNLQQQSGSGDASIFATDSVTVAANGSGKIKVSGNPVTRSVYGNVEFKRLRG